MDHIRNKIEEQKVRLTPLREKILNLPMSKSGKRLGISVQLKEQIVEAFERSNLPEGIFATEVGISNSSLTTWKRKYRKNELRSKTNKNEFRQIPIHPLEKENSSEFIVEGPLGLRIVGMDVQHLSELMRSLC